MGKAPEQGTDGNQSIADMSLEDFNRSAASVADRMRSSARGADVHHEDDDEARDRAARAAAPAQSPQAGETLTPEQLAELELDRPEPKPGDENLNVDLDRVPEQYRPNFKAMRAKLEAQERELADLRARTEQAATGQGLEDATEEMKQLVEQNKQLRGRLAELDYSSTDEFKTRFDVPLGALAEQIKSAVAQYGGDEALAQRLMLSDARGRHAIIAEALPDAAAYLPALFAQVDALQAQRRMALSRHAESARNRTAEQEQVAAQQEQEQMDALRVEAMKRAAAGKHTLLQKVAGESDNARAWNARVDAITAEIAGMFSVDADVNKQADALVMAALAPHYHRLYLAAAKQLNDLRTEFVRRNGSVPRLSGIARAPAMRGQPPAGGAPRTAAEAASLSASRLPV